MPLLNPKNIDDDIAELMRFSEEGEDIVSKLRSCDLKELRRLQFHVTEAITAAYDKAQDAKRNGDSTELFEKQRAALDAVRRKIVEIITDKSQRGGRKKKKAEKD